MVEHKSQVQTIRKASTCCLWSCDNYLESIHHVPDLNHACMHAWMHWYCMVQFHAVRTCSQTKCIPTAADLYWEFSRLHASWCIALVAMELFDCSLKAAEHGLRSGEKSGSWDVLGIPALASEWFVEDVAATNWIDCQQSGKVTVTRCCFRVEFWKKASLSHVLDPLSLQWCNGLSMSMCMKEG